MGTVSIERCEEYRIDLVRLAVRRAVDALGGMQAFVSPGERVLLKPNLLMRRKPDRATTTHPAVVQAVAELVVEAGGKPIIFDSPGGYVWHTAGTLAALYETCGMQQAAAESGAELCFDTETVEAELPDGFVIKRVKTVRAVLEADKIINLPKLKTHMMMTFSGAVKNLFGIVPGSAKTEYHFRFKNEEDFAGALLDICTLAKPALTVIDAVVGMEGEGPTNGHPRQIGLVFAGANPYELDVVASASVGLKPSEVPTVKVSIRRKLCQGKPEDVTILGERLHDVTVPDFRKPGNKVAFNIWNWLLPEFLAKRLNRAMKFKPAFRPERCRQCGVCATSCPAKAIDMAGGTPRVDPDLCISCFCCHELCNFDAVQIKRPWLMRQLFR